MNAFFQDQPTSEFFLFLQHFILLFRACDKRYQNHGVNMVLKALKIALKTHQKQNTSTNTKSAKNTTNTKNKRNKNNAKNTKKIQYHFQFIMLFSFLIFYTIKIQKHHERRIQIRIQIRI